MRLLRFAFTALAAFALILGAASAKKSSELQLAKMALPILALPTSRRASDSPPQFAPGIHVAARSRVLKVAWSRRHDVNVPFLVRACS